MSTYYVVPTTDKSLSSVKSTVIASGISLLFMYLVLPSSKVDPLRLPDRGDIRSGAGGQGEEPCQAETAGDVEGALPVHNMQYCCRNAAMVSIYPPFYYGPHSAILSWITLIVLFLMHLFCVFNKSCKSRSVWSVFYLIYHLCIAVWIFLVLVVGYTWANQQPAAYDE
jgi:hypothetical protein